MVPIATACADSDDFSTEDGRLILNPHVVQNSTEAFSFPLNAGQNVFEQVPQFNALNVLVSGCYILTMDAHAVATLPAAPASAGPLTARVSAEIRRNGASIAGTETMLVLNGQGSTVPAAPPISIHGSGSCTRAQFFAAGDQITLWAKRSGDVGTVCEIISDDDGRCRITAVRFAGACA